MYSAILNLLATLPLAACCESGFVQAATEQQRPEAPASAEAPATYPQSIDGRLVLSREAASADGALEFEVAIGACSDDECPVLVSLLRGNTILDQRPTNWSSSTAQPITEELEPGWGAGDPGRPAAVRAWSTGEEEGYLGTVVRPVRLAMDTYGLLIDQLTGFEHLKRRHELYVATDNKLTRVWEAEEGAGPAWTSTAIVPLEAGREGILYFDGFLSPQDTEPDQLEISLLKWDVDGRKLSTTSQFAVPAIEVADYASVAAAQQARSAQPNCLGLFWVFPADRLSGGAGKYALALPGSSEADLHAVLEQASACVKDRQVSLTSLRQR